MSDRSLHAIVHGRVQGVGFRWFVQRRARELGLDGYARNLADGTVEVYAQGEAEALKTLKKHLERGPSGAHVARVDVRLGEASASGDGFQIR
jgi:acylphosphatase